MNFIVLSIIAILFFVALSLSHTRPKTALCLTIFFAPWSGLGIDIGLSVNPYLILLTSLIIIFLLQSILQKQSIPTSRIFIFFILYAVAWSIVQIPFLPEATVAGGALRSPVARAISQVIRFLLMVSPVFVVPFLLRNSKDLTIAAKVYIWSAIILALLGWVQLGIWSATGNDPFPIGFVSSLAGRGGIRSGIDIFEGISIHRMSSFGGEPRDLGQGLVIALLLIQIILSYGKGSMSGKLKMAWLFLFVSMLTTLSTSAIYLWVIGTFAIFCILFASRLRLQNKGHVVFGIRIMPISFWLLFIVLLSMATPTGSHYFANGLGLLKQRTIERDAVEDFDAAIIGFLKDKPQKALLGVGLGNAHIYSNKYLPPQVWFYAYGTCFVAKSGYLKLLSELGIIGLCLFMFWVIQETKFLQQGKIMIQNNHDIPDIKIINITYVFGLTASICYLARGGYVGPQTFLGLGACAAARTIFLKRKRP